MLSCQEKRSGRTLIREIFVWTAREIVVAVIIFRGIEARRAREARKRIQDPYLTIKLNPSTRRRSCAKKYFTSCLYVSAVTLTPNPIFPIGSLVGIRCQRSERSSRGTSVFTHAHIAAYVCSRRQIFLSRSMDRSYELLFSFSENSKCHTYSDMSM